MDNQLIPGMKRFIKYILLFIMPLSVLADDATTITIARPTVAGTIRARGEWSTATGLYRFMVRTGRVSISGDLTPNFTYRAELDLCDRGAVKVTDVWARVNLRYGFKIQAGQMRMPFTFGSARGPQVYLFANRPTVDKQIIGPRNAGVKLIYNCGAAPLTIEGGVFNSTSLTNHSQWQRRLAAAAKALYKAGLLTMITGYESLAPGTVRINHYNIGASLSLDRWMLEAEYVNKHYAHNCFKNAHAYNFMTNYMIPLRSGMFDALSLQLRFDGLTDNWNGTSYAKSDDGTETPALTDHAWNRLSGGVTFSRKIGAVWTDLRINYENYFMHHGVKQTADVGNLLLAELALRF